MNLEFSDPVLSLFRDFQFSTSLLNQHMNGDLEMVGFILLLRHFLCTDPSHLLSRNIPVSQLQELQAAALKYDVGMS
jgi:hypothetical protein